jgi:hypothetical protein
MNGAKDVTEWLMAVAGNATFLEYSSFIEMDFIHHHLQGGTS